MDQLTNMDDNQRKKLALTLSTLSPAIIALILLIFNPNYILEIFKLEAPFVVEPYLPCGWVVVAVTIILLGSFRFIYWLLDEKAKPGCIHPLLKMIAFALFFLTIFAANLIVVLGPAIFQVFRMGTLR
jgi:hypothetical protein